MTNMQEFNFLSSDGKTGLHGISWLPEGTPRAVLQIAHGVAEYIGRYDGFARFLNEQGIAVVGHDHLGHGQSVTENGTPIYFGDGNTWQTVVDDMYLLHNRLRQQFPNVPMVLMGHSMGSFLARTYLIRYPGTVDAAIVMGTGWQGSLVLAGGLLISKLVALRGSNATSDFVTNLAFGSYNKHIKPQRTAFDWLSADTENVDAYIADPLCGQPTTVGLFREMLKGFQFNQKFGNLDKMNHDTPVLLIAGQEDPVGDYGAGVRQTYQEFKRSGVRDCTVKLYPGLRHEILNEKAQQAQVYADIAAWLEEKIK